MQLLLALTAVLALCRLSGVRAQIRIMARLVALVIGGMERVGGNRLLLVLPIGSALAAIAGYAAETGISGYVGAIAGVAAKLAGLRGIGAQIGVMSRLIALVLGCVEGIRRHILLLAIIGYVLGVNIVGAVSRCELLLILLVVAGAGAKAGRIVGVGAQICIVIGLVSAVICCMVALEPGLLALVSSQAVAGVLLVVALLVVLAIHGLNISGRLERFLCSPVLGVYILAGGMGAGSLRIASQVSIVIRLIAAIVGSMKLPELIHR